MLVGAAEGVSVGATVGLRLMDGAAVGEAVGDRLTAVAVAPVTPYDA